MAAAVVSWNMGTHADDEVIRRDPATARAVREHMNHILLLGRAATTREQRLRALIRLQAALPVPLLQATKDDMYEWRAGLTVGPTTINTYVSNVREFYRWALARGLISSDPSAGIPVPPIPRRLPRPIPSADLAHAIGVASVIVRPMLILAASCGMRAKEIAGLRAENVRLGDTPPNILIVSEATKGLRERVIPLSPFVVAELKRAGLPPPRGPVFPDANGHHRRPWRISKICNDHLHGCGITSTLHTLRHWCGTEAYAVDHDLRAVQELLGHAVVQTTAGYAASNRARTAAIVNAMPPPVTFPEAG